MAASRSVRIPDDVLEGLDEIVEAAGPLARTRGDAIRLLLIASRSPQEVIAAAVAMVAADEEEGRG